MVGHAFRFKHSMALSFVLLGLGCGDDKGKSDPASTAVPTEESGNSEDGAADGSEAAEDGTQLLGSKVTFLNIPAAGVATGGVFKLQLKMENFAPGVIWSAGASARKDSVVGKVSFVLFDQSTTATEANIDTFLINETEGTHYLFIVVIYPDGTSERHFAPGPLIINNLGIPRVEVPRFFSDALGVDKNLAIPNPVKCCVFIQDEVGKTIAFEVKTLENIDYTLELLRGAAVQTLAANKAVFTQPEDNDPDSIRLEYTWTMPTPAYEADSNYRLRITATNLTTNQVATVASPQFGIFYENREPSYAYLTAPVVLAANATPEIPASPGGILTQSCSGATCHNTADRQLKLADHGTFFNYDYRDNDSNDIMTRVYAPTAMRTVMPPTASGITMSEEFKKELRLYIQAGSPEPPP
jgi:hypothetical protein